MSVSPSFYRAERRWIHSIREQLRRERWLRVHVALIATCTLCCLLLGGALLRWAGVDTLAWRYALLLPLTYLIYLALLRLWASYLLRRDSSACDGTDLGSESPGGGSNSPFESGGGGEFGGGGASGDFGGDLAEGAAEIGGEVLGSMDEGAVALVPLVALLAIIALLASLLSAAILMLFGIEVLLAVAVEVALSAWLGGLAYRRHRAGWLGRALGHTWRGALTLLVLGLALGAAIDHWLPAADSLPAALTLLRGRA